MRKPFCSSLSLLALLMVVVPLGASTVASSSSKLSERLAPPPSVEKVDSAALIAMLQDKRDSYRSAAAQELGRRKVAAAVAPLRELLKDELPFIRVDAAEALLALGDQSGLPVLRDVLKTGTPATALRAAGVLATQGDNAGLALAQSELKSPYFTNRIRAIKALNSGKDEETAYAALQIGLGDSEHQVRTEALYLLGKRGTLRSIEMIKPFLHSSDSSERYTALWAIIDTRLWDGIPLLIDALSDPNVAMRITAHSWLNQLTRQNRPADPRFRPENVKELERQWREWWEENKAKYPSGGKSDVVIPNRRKAKA